jgi:hypothetical protein
MQQAVREGWERQGQERNSDAGGNESGAAAAESPHDGPGTVAESAARAARAAVLGEEWLEVYSDASVKLGVSAAEDRCGVVVWAAHRINSRGEQQEQEVTAKAEGAAIHLGWVGLERVDSTVGELFGAIIAVLAAPASAELEALPVW